MLAYVLRRLVLSLLILLGVSVFVFFLVRLVPGDMVTALLGPHYSEAEAQTLRERYGLDRPLAVQYGVWLGRVARGDLGESLFTGKPVAEAIGERLPVTLQLAAMAALLAVVVGVPLGVLAALRSRGPADYLSTGVALLGVSIPPFWLGTMLILGASLHLGWLPSGGYVGPLGDPLANLRHMLLPALAMGAVVAAVVMRMTRSSMLEVIGQDYIRRALAQGVPRSRVIWRHGLRNGLIPVLTVLGIQIGYLLGSSVVIEQVFALPGVGRLLLQAITNRDYALVQGVVLFIGAAFILLNLVVDLLYAALDPRIRYGED